MDHEGEMKRGKENKGENQKRMREEWDVRKERRGGRKGIIQNKKGRKVEEDEERKEGRK